MNNFMLKPLGLSLLAASLGSMASVASAASVAEQAEGILNSQCVACHTKEGDNQWSRISHQRKTPEGWLMTIARMQVMHGLEISDADRRVLVKHLSDTQGLAPEETDGYRYVLERRLNAQESIEPALLAEGCARCHSGARFKLQRRDEAEWEHLAHFHLGQYPSAEYQMLSRDRDWFPIMMEKLVPMLGEQQPLQSSEWSSWQQATKTEMKGRWSVAGHMPGKGDLTATMVVTPLAGKDQFSVSMSGQYADGTPLQGSGKATLYTGYEWRANLTIDGVRMRQVFAVRDGQLTGRMFNRNDESMGADISAAHMDGRSTLLAVQPAYIKAGTQSELTLVGTGLSGMPTFGKGVEVVSIRKDSDRRMHVTVRASRHHEGVNSVSIGKAKGVELAVYKDIDKVNVVPDYAVARVGGNGGSTDKLFARFEAEAWSAGKDGKTGTADDFRIGMVPATWEAKPFDDIAAADNDLSFAGRLDARTGVFSTADAGPNPQRRMMTNNAGHLTVTAQVQDGNQTHSADAELIVTIQRWNNPPIP